ncbi:MAG TPA: hypothetical protein VMD02_04090, partial [Candidatus Omnitrophota bacterium]|nr:hypothetical protein [Candidatus Omnitrophota bacterium]
RGKLNRDSRTEELNMIAEQVDPLADLEKIRSLNVEMVDVQDKQVLERLKNILLFYKGSDPVVLYYDGSRIPAGSKFRVDINPDLVNQIEELLGTGSVRVEYNHRKKEAAEPAPELAPY